MNRHCGCSYTAFWQLESTHLLIPDQDLLRVFRISIILTSTIPLPSFPSHLAWPCCWILERISNKTRTRLARNCDGCSVFEHSGYVLSLRLSEKRSRIKILIDSYDWARGGRERPARGIYGRFWGGMLDGWVGLVVWRSCCGDDVGLDLACVDVEEGIESSSSSNQVFGGDRAPIRDHVPFPSLQDERSILEESRTVSSSQSWHKRYIMNNLPIVIRASKQYLPGRSSGAELAFFCRLIFEPRQHLLAFNVQDCYSFTCFDIFRVAGRSRRHSHCPFRIPSLQRTQDVKLRGLVGFP